MNLIIGLNAFHPDSAACALRDGKLVAAVAEERLGSRLKHVAGFPQRALNEVLRMAGATIRDVDYLAIGNNGNANLGAKIGHVLTTPFKSAQGVVTHFQRRSKMRSMTELVADACGVQESDCRFKVERVEHHLAHIASSYYASGFDQAAGFSYDGAGDFTSAMYARCEGNRIEVLDRVHVPHSLGFFYTGLCQFIGFERFGEEYKVMGLAAYGQPAYLDLMHELLKLSGGGQFLLNDAFFQSLGKNLEECVDENGEIVLPALYTDELARRLGPPRARGADFSKRDKDIAASCQAHFETVVMRCLEALHKRVPVDTLITAGGCALNGVCNARIVRDTPFRRSYIQCAASDDGTAVGAALHVWNAVLNKPRAGAIEHGFWGPEHSEQEMEAALRSSGLSFERFEGKRLFDQAAEHLNRGHVTGWYQGRSEWGPRALGNRSILAHPGWPGMKELINAKIKRREAFRPFAPSILEEAVGDYFEQTVQSPFMMHVVRIRPEKRIELSAVCHEDGTGRLQTVSRHQNASYYDLIKAFSKKSGTPVVLNTSFNENEPVVDTPQQAVNCFTRTDMDVLVLGPFITCKSGKAC
ncbi:MAG TPA: carbamoyltransferase C-terminal domain-containing protein [Clostridia bacterium]|nr:carbamoyltransferase C-terminal domain-containing protein [Clostridia bacterium]